VIYFGLRKNMRNKVIIVGVLFFVLLFVQFISIKYLKSNLIEAQSLEQQNRLLASTLNSKADYVAYYKSAIKTNEIELPRPIDSPTACYEIIVKLLGTHAVAGSEIKKDSEDGDSISFKVAGTTDYLNLMQLFLSFRKSPYMFILTNVSILHAGSNDINFTFTIQAKKRILTTIQERS
jgi:hypothetical protein